MNEVENEMTNEPQRATVLPPECAQELQNAASIQDAFERIRAIDTIVERLKFKHQKLFRSEEDDRENRNQ